MARKFFSDVFLPGDSDLFVGGKLKIGDNTAATNILHVVSGTADTVARFESGDSTAKIQIKDNVGTAHLGTTNTEVFLGPNATSSNVSNIRLHNGNNQAGQQGYAGYGATPSAGHKFRVGVSYNTSADTTMTGISADMNVSGTDAVTADRTIRAFFADIDSSATGGNTSDELRLTGFESHVTDTGDSDLSQAFFGQVQNTKTSALDNVTNIIGGRFSALADNSAGTITNIMGTYSTARVKNSGTKSAVYINRNELSTSTSDADVSNVYGVYSRLEPGTTYTGTIANSRAGYFEIESEANNTFTNAYAIEARIDHNAGTITNAYQFRGVTQGTITSNNWGIHSTGAAINRIDGKLSVNTTNTPTHDLTVGGDIRLTGNSIFDDGSIISDGTNFGFDGAAGKEVYISSARDIRLIIDDNNDDTNTDFNIYKHSVASGNELLTINQSGNASFTGYVSATQFRPTNIVTNKVVKFNGTQLDDSIITDDGSSITIQGDELTLGDGTYQTVLFDTSPSSVIGNGTMEIQPTTAPGSGTANFTTYFKDRTGGGTTKHHVKIDGNITVSGGTITLGNDVSLFDDGVNILRTDDIFHANNDIHVGGDGKLYDRANTANYIELSNTIGISTNTNISGNLTAVNITSTSNSGDASIHINSTRPTLGFSDTNSYTDANDIYIIRGTGGNKLAFQWYDDSAASTTETFNIDKDGIATFNGKIRNSHGSAGAPTYSFTSKTDTGMYVRDHSSNDRLGFTIDGTERFYIDSNGITSLSNIYFASGSSLRNYSGIWKATTGTSGNGFTFANTADNSGAVLLNITSSSSSASASVATFSGTVDATNFKINGAQGSDGQVLTSTGSGVAWENPTGGGTIDGSGTANDVVMWSDSDTLTDAPIAISGTTSTFGGNVTIDPPTGNAQFTLRLDTTGDSTIIGDVNWNSTGAEGTDDRLGIIRTRTQGGTTSTRGGEMVLYTRIANSSGFNTTTYAQNGQWTFPHHINLSDNKYLMWGGNAILWHTGSYTYVGDNSSSSALSLTGGKLGIGGNPSARLHVTIPQETDGAVRNELARFTHTSQNTMSIFAYGGSTDLIQLGAWNNEQNISIVTETLSNISATSTKGIYIKSGGNVGLGTVNPGTKLDVNAGGSDTVASFVSTDARARILLQDNNDISYFGTLNGTTFIGTVDTTHTQNLTLTSSGYLGVGTTNPDEKLHVMYAHADGTATTYAKAVIEDTDAQLDLLSTSDGTWGSSINLVEAAGSGANTDVWAMARKTTGGNGDSSLNFNFGTGNLHSNTTRVSFSSAGNITMGGDLTVEGGDIYLNDTNTRLTEGNGNAFRITTNSGYGEFGPMNTGHCHIQTDRTNFYFNRQIQVDSGIVSSYNEDLNLRRAVSDAGSLTLNVGAFYSKAVNDSQVQLGGFTINTALEDTYHCYIPGISPNEFAGAHRRLTVTATKNGTSISANSLGPAFLAHEETYSVSTSNTDTIIIEIAGWGLSYGQWYGITFGAAQWRAKDIDIEISSDNGANYTTIYSENNQPHATVRTYHGGNNTSMNKIRYTLTNWNTTSTRINHIFGYKYLEGDTNYLDKFRDESIYGAMNWKDGYPATFGNSGDLVIKHSGSDSIIETHASLAAGDLYIKSQGTNHDLYLQAADDIFIRPQNGENGIKVIGNGQVELYHDNELRLGTTSTGARFTKQQNAGSRLELYNNRQDASNVEVWRIAAYNSVEVTGVHFYRGGGGSSGYTKIFAKKNNASSLEEVVQFGTNDSLLSEFQGPVKVNGDLEVTGITTTVNQTNLDVSDNLIGLNRGSTSNSNDSGLIIERGSTGDNAAFLWDESADRFVFGTTTANPAATGNITYTAAAFGAKGLWTTTSAVTHWGPGPNSTVYGTLTWDTGYAAVHANGSNVLRLGSGSDTDAVIIDGSNMSVAGNITHHGLTPTDGTDIDQIKEFAMTFQLTANTWTDTDIAGSDLPTGTYIMQAYVSDFNVGGGHYYEHYSATISWYGQNTNSTHVDEIPVHRAGHAPNNGDVQFRTERHASGNLMLQVKHNMSYNAALDNSDGGKIFRFKFRRLI